MYRIVLRDARIHYIYIYIYIYICTVDSLDLTFLSMKFVTITLQMIYVFTVRNDILSLCVATEAIVKPCLCIMYVY